MSEQTDQPQEEVQLPEELNEEQSFNLLVNLARQSKLTYDEHALVDKAVRTLSQALNLQ
jgi:hypothetical protein|tara:strand:+ start:1388 stop:1564 length:177 start_codon:yes stop_codon:yes gene_type:complete